MSVALFNKAQSMVNAEARRANGLLLGQMKSHLDMIMEDALQLSFIVSDNDRLESLLYERLPVESSEYYRAYRVARDFYTYRVASSEERIIEFYAYLPQLDMILSPRGYFTTRNYHLSQMSKTGVSYDEWIGGFASVRRRIFAKSVAESDREDVKDTIAIVSPLPATIRTGGPSGWVVVHVNADLFREIFEDSLWTSRSIVLVQHRDFGIISASLSGLPAEVVAAMDSNRAEEPNTRITIDGIDYVAFTRESDIPKWRYLSLVPLDIYTDRFRTLSRFAIVAFIFCGIVGVTLILVVSAARYRPVKRLLSLVQPDADGTVSLRSDEFALITKRLELTIAEDRTLRREVSEAKPVLAQRALRQLLKGRASFDERMRSELAALGVAFPHPHLVLVLFEVDSAPRIGTDRNVVPLPGLDLSRATPPASIAYWVRDIDGYVGLLANRPAPDIDDVYEWLVRTKRSAEYSGAASWAAGISSAHPLPSAFATAYHEAYSALSYRLVRGRRLPIRYSEVVVSGQAYYYPIERETKLINSIKTGDSRTAVAILEDIFRRNFARSRLSVEMARCLMFDLISTMVKSMNAIASGNEDAEFWSTVRPVSRLTACRSLERLQTEMSDILHQVCAHVLDGMPSQAEQHRKEIVDFVEKHYRDKNLNPEIIASHLGKNAAYLSRIFRDQASIGIGGYIRTHRVERAKDLLEAGSLTIREVAEAVGFADSNALIRAFKKTEGITPGEFRSASAIYRR